MQADSDRPRAPISVPVPLDPAEINRLRAAIAETHQLEQAIELGLIGASWPDQYRSSWLAGSRQACQVLQERIKASAAAGLLPAPDNLAAAQRGGKLRLIELRVRSQADSESD